MTQAGAALLRRPTAGALWGAAAQPAAHASNAWGALWQTLQGVHAVAQEPPAGAQDGSTTAAAQRDCKDVSTSGRESLSRDLQTAWQHKHRSRRKGMQPNEPLAVPTHAAQQQQPRGLLYEEAVEQLEAAIRAKDFSRIAEYFQPRAVQLAPDGGAALLHALLRAATLAHDAPLTRAVLLVMRQQDVKLSSDLHRSVLHVFSSGSSDSRQHAVKALEKCMPRRLLPRSHGSHVHTRPASASVDNELGDDGSTLPAAADGMQRWAGRLRQLAAQGDLPGVLACWQEWADSTNGSAGSAMVAHSRLLVALHSMLHSKVEPHALSQHVLAALRGLVHSYLQCLVDRWTPTDTWQQQQQQRCQQQLPSWQPGAAGDGRPPPQQQVQQQMQQLSKQQWVPLPMQANAPASAWGAAPYHALATATLIDSNSWVSMVDSSQAADAAAPASWVPAGFPRSLLALATPAERALLCKCTTKAMHLAGELVDGQCMQQLLALRSALSLAPHADMYHPLMDVALWQGAAPEVLEDMLAEMVAYGLMPKAAHYEELLECYAQHGDAAAAEAVLDRMADVGLVPTLRTYNRLLHGLAVSADMDAAQRVYDRLLAAGLTPDVQTMGRLFKVVRYYAKHVRLECARKMGEAETRGQQRQQLSKRSARFADCYQRLVAWQEDMVALRLQHNAVSLQHLVKALERLNAVADCIELARMYEELRPGDFLPHRAALHVSGRHRSMQAVTYAQQLARNLGDRQALQEHHDTLPVAASQYWLLRDKAALEEGLAQAGRASAGRGGAGSTSRSSSAGSGQHKDSVARQKFMVRTYCTLGMWQEALNCLDSMLQDADQQDGHPSTQQASSSSSSSSQGTSPGPITTAAVQAASSSRELAKSPAASSQRGVPVGHASGYGTGRDSVWHVVMRFLMSRDAPDAIVSEFAARMAPQQLHRFAVMYDLRRRPGTAGGYTLRRVLSDGDDDAERGNMDGAISSDDSDVEGLEFLDEEEDEPELGWGPPLHASQAAAAPEMG